MYVVFQDDMYDSTCLERGHALLLEISNGRSCIVGVHVFRMAYFKMCFTERYVLLEVMFYLRVCIIGGHV